MVISRKTIRLYSTDIFIELQHRNKTLQANRIGCKQKKNFLYEKSFLWGRTSKASMFDCKDILNFLKNGGILKQVGHFKLRFGDKKGI